MGVENLVVDCPGFWDDNLGDKHTYEDYTCDITDLWFSSNVVFLGGEYLELFKITGLKIHRYPFGDESGVGVTEAKIITDDMKIVTDTFQFIGGVGIGR